MTYYLRSGILIFICSLLLFSLHYLGVYLYYDGDEFSTEPPLVSIHIFLFVTTFIITMGLRFLYDLVPDQVGVIFLVAIMLKIGAALIVFPMLLNGSISTLETVSFLVAYLSYLTIEAVALARWLNRR